MNWLVVGLLQGAFSGPPDAEVKSLPGWKGPLPSRLWSGFVDAGIPPGYPSGSMHMHYWFAEAEKDPSTAPVVVWYNGGPGASSLFGVLVELGPLLLNADSLNAEYNRTGIPQLIANPYGWTKVANLLAFNNPPPIGFSYCDPIGPTGNGTSCGPWKDDLVAKANLLALANWVRAFPEFAKNDLYLVGESYAGIYVPTIAQEIMNHPESGVNLKGFAVGDGCMGTEVLCGKPGGPWYEILFFHGHGQFSDELHHTIMTSCPERDLRNGNLTQRCKDLVTQMRQEIGGYYDYALYDDCVGQNEFLLEEKISSRQLITPYHQQERNWWGPPLSRSGGVSAGRLGGGLNDYACPGPAMDLWLNRTDVRNALHVAENSYFFNGDNGVGFDYTLTEKNVLLIYLRALQETNLRVLVYNGDTDPGLNSFVTQDIIVDFLRNNNVQKKQAWRPWTLDGKQRMGGYVIDWAQGAKGGKFQYLTIRGSGHMVPEFKPAASLEFLARFLRNEPYQPYVPLP